MIYFRVINDDQVSVTVDTGVRIRGEAEHVGRAECWIECADPLHAQLLRNQLTNHLEDVVKQIRARAYEKGWRDAKAKKRKATEFAVVLDPLSTLDTAGCW